MVDIPEILSRRERKLAKYREEREKLNAEITTLSNQLKRRKQRQRDVSNAIYDLLHESDEVPSVTDHAVVQYLRRVKGVDIMALKAEVANHEKAQRECNVIVTVNGDLTAPTPTKDKK